MLARIVEYLKNLVLGNWKPTVTGIFSAVIGVCLIVIGACGEVLYQAIFDDTTIADPTARIAATATRDGVIIGIGILCLVILAGSIALIIAKFRAAIARQRALKHHHDEWRKVLMKHP